MKNLIMLIVAVFLLAGAGNALAHCDTLDGPVVAEARQALTAGDVTPVLKWVTHDEEENVKAAFRHTLAVRQLGDEAKKLADMYFFETLVRIHRAGEGAPYTGLKADSHIDPAVALADKAIQDGSVEKLTNVLGGALRDGLSSRYAQVSAALKRSGESVEAGREYVKAYVQFTHFAEGVHGLIKGGAHHHDET